MIAICIGHSRKVQGRREGGALAVDGTSEWGFNSKLGRRVVAILCDRHGVEAVLVDDYSGTGYPSAMRWLASTLRRRGVTLAVELHFNSAENANARGHEWLFWHTSRAGMRLAVCLQAAMDAAFPSLLRRGVKGITGADRGGMFLRLTHCPAVICEPFFGSHAGDWQVATEGAERLADALASAITTYQQS
jgi:N-acetylmuramoyl-L-alanine amidase